MKFCERPWKYWWLVAANGEVTSCPWFTDQTLRTGNILKQDMKEIAEGEETSKTY